MTSQAGCDSANVDHVESDASEFAWRVHSLQEAWIARVDVKASIILAVESGLLVGAATAARRGSTETPTIGLIGVALVVVAMCCAGAAVVPALGRIRRQRQRKSDDLLYFGHLRHLTDGELADRIRALSLDGQVDALSRQITILSRINWWKHRLLLMSLVLLFAAIAVLAIDAVVPLL